MFLPISSAQSCDRGILCPEPFLKHDEAEEHLVIVPPPCAVLFKQLTNTLRTQILENLGIAIEQRVSNLVVHRIAKPIIHNVAGKPSLLTFHDGLRKKLSADLA